MKINKQVPIEGKSKSIDLVKTVMRKLGKWYARLIDDKGDPPMAAICIAPNNPDELTPKNYPYRMILKPSDVEAGSYHVVIKDMKSGDTLEDTIKLNLTLDDPLDDKQLHKQLSKLLSKLSGGNSGDYEINDVVTIESSTMYVTLHKVVGSDIDTSINLVAIKCADSLIDTQATINDIVSDDDFIESMPDNEDVSYEIQICDDTYDISLCDSTCADNSAMFTALYQLYFTAWSIELHAFGADMNTLQSECNSIRWMCENQIHTLSTITSDYVDPISAAQFLPTTIGANSYRMNDGFQMLLTAVTTVVDTFELCWCNFNQSDQLIISQMILEWKAKLQYYTAVTM